MTPLKTTLAALFLFACAGAACSDPPKEDPPPVDECPAGDRGCECKADMTCATDLTCFNGVCLSDDDLPDPNPDPNPDNPNPDPNPGPNPDPNPDVNPDPNPGMNPFDGLGLGVSDDAARACEVVLRDTQNKIGEVTFDEAAVRGRTMRRGERIAIAFHVLEGTSIASGAVRFTQGEGATDVEGVEVVVGQCIDTQGQPLPGAEVTIIDQR